MSQDRVLSGLPTAKIPVISSIMDAVSAGQELFALAETRELRACSGTSSSARSP